MSGISTNCTNITLPAEVSQEIMQKDIRLMRKVVA